jgi:hypothetical protein
MLSMAHCAPSGSCRRSAVPAVVRGQTGGGISGRGQGSRARTTPVFCAYRSPATPSLPIAMIRNRCTLRRPPSRWRLQGGWTVVDMDESLTPCAVVDGLTRPAQHPYP